MRDSKTTRFTKVVRVTEEDYAYLVRTKGRKSIAGRLEEIIKQHKKDNN
jgi:predicted CopG family antitoxin